MNPKKSSVERRWHIELLLWLGIMLPPLVTYLMLFAISGARYKPSVLPIAMAVGSLPPFLLLRYLVRIEIAPLSNTLTASRRPSVAPLFLAWIVMLLIYACFTFAVEWDTSRHALGSATNAVGVVALPIVMIIAGMMSYALGTLVALAISRVRQPRG